VFPAAKEARLYMMIKSKLCSSDHLCSHATTTTTIIIIIGELTEVLLRMKQ